MPVKTWEEAHVLVKDWLISRSFSILVEDIGKDDINFQFESKNSSGIGFAVIQTKKLPRSLIIVSKLNFHQRHQERLDSMSDKEREEIYWNLRRDFIFIPATFMFMPAKSPNAIQFSKEISFDELTEGRLTESLDQVLRGAVWVIWVFGRIFDEAIHT
jgi:hypothetical protein